MKHNSHSVPHPPVPGGPRLDAYAVAMELAALMREPLVRLRLQSRSLEQQARNALQSTVLNLAEGAGKLGSSRREQARFYCIARGSAVELQAALHLCRAWGWLDAATLERADGLLDRLRAMLHRLIARAA
jgi:four helix bundle protein